MPNTHPPAYTTRFIELPLSRLHVLETGEGDPLIMVPATISDLDDWRTLAQFMGQWFHVYFFELPGHGGSEPFKDEFSSHRVAELVSQLADDLGHERFNLMGFSFGGILAMRSFKLLSPRIDRLVLIAPCLDHRALPFSRLRLSLLYRFNRLLAYPKIQARFHSLVRDRRTVSLVVKGLQNMGRLEETIPLEKKFLQIRASTLAVLNAQVNEILTAEFDLESKYDTPCYFAMSIYDPLVRFDTTLGILENHFVKMNTLRLTYPFHQPPRPFTFEELNRDFYATIDSFMRSGM